MTELWRARRDVRVRGWLLSAEAAARTCCRAIAPVLMASAHRRSRIGSLRSTVELALNPRCQRRK